MKWNERNLPKIPMSFCNRINQEKKEKEKEKKMKTRLQRRIEEATHLRGGVVRWNPWESKPARSEWPRKGKRNEELISPNPPSIILPATVSLFRSRMPENVGPVKLKIHLAPGAGSGWPRGRRWEAWWLSLVKNWRAFIFSLTGYLCVSCSCPRDPRYY